MLDELKEFLNIPKIPPKIKLYSTFLVNTKSQTQVSSYKSMLRRLSNTKKVSIMEKINQMKKKEEEKKKALMDNLKKNKKMNLQIKIVMNIKKIMIIFVNIEPKCMMIYLDLFLL